MEFLFLQEPWGRHIPHPGTKAWHLTTSLPVRAISSLCFASSLSALRLWNLALNFFNTSKQQETKDSACRDYKIRIKCCVWFLFLAFGPTRGPAFIFILLTSWLTVVLSSSKCNIDRWSKDISSLETITHDCCSGKDGSARSNKVTKHEISRNTGEKSQWPLISSSNKMFLTSIWRSSFTTTWVIPSANHPGFSILDLHRRPSGGIRWINTYHDIPGVLQSLYNLLALLQMLRFLTYLARETELFLLHKQHVPPVPHSPSHPLRSRSLSY